MSDSAKIEDTNQSSGTILNIYSNNFSNDFFQSPLNTDDKVEYYELESDFSFWEFKRKYNLGLFINAFAYYYYDKFNTSENETDYAKFRVFAGNVLTGFNFYPFKNNFYTSGTFGSTFVLQKDESSHNVIILSDTRSGSTNYAWSGIGYGRIFNLERKYNLENFEEILLKEKYINKPLSKNLKEKILSLLDKRNNKDFISKYKDNSEAEFFDQLEKLLIDQKEIDDNLNARTSIELLESLRNPKFVHYPRFAGYLLQADLQVQMNKHANQNFLSFRSIAGKLLSEQSQILFSGYIAIPLTKSASVKGLFNYFINPFSNFIPVLFQRYQLQPNNYLEPRVYIYDTDANQQIFLGAKTIFFNSFSEFIGIRPYFEILCNKPSGLNANLLSTFGVATDYNIFSKLTLNLLLEANVSNRYKPKYYYNLIFFYNIL